MAKSTNSEAPHYAIFSILVTYFLFEYSLQHAVFKHPQLIFPSLG